MMNLIYDFLNLIYPPKCCICNTNLISGEDCICLKCLCNLQHSDDNANGLSENFLFSSPGLPPSLAYCPFIFEKGSCTQTLIHKMKYEDKPQIGYRLAKYAAKELLRAESPLCNCDLIVPVPLHKKKLRKRGYNQSLWIAKGLHHVWKTEISTNCIERIYNNQTQTQKDVYERWKHKDLAFKVKEPETICGKSILIIDDVITTGTTIKACAIAIAEAKPKEINFFALCHT